MNLTAKDIVLIMQRAAKLGVTSLTIGELDISFSTNRSIPQEASISQKPTVVANKVEDVVEVQQHKIIEQHEKKLESYRKSEEDFLNLPVLDPVAWEEEQANILQSGVDADSGEIEDATGLQI